MSPESGHCKLFEVYVTTECIIPIFVQATMLKCQDIRNLDTCDFFRTYQVVKLGCSENSTAEDEDLYNMFFHHTTPR